jgi:hypothetical protein
MFAKSLKVSALALSVVTFFSALPISSAQAQYYRRNATGDAIAGGVIGGVVGGLATGALLNANRPPVYGAPVYGAPVYGEPVYGEPAPSYHAPTYHSEGPYLRERPVYWARPGLARSPDLEVVPSCYQQRQRIWLDRYTYTHRYTRVCD